MYFLRERAVSPEVLFYSVVVEQRVVDIKQKHNFAGSFHPTFPNLPILLFDERAILVLFKGNF